MSPPDSVAGSGAANLGGRIAASDQPTGGHDHVEAVDPALWAASADRGRLQRHVHGLTEGARPARAVEGYVVDVGIHADLRLPRRALCNYQVGPIVGTGHNDSPARAVALE